MGSESPLLQITANGVQRDYPLYPTRYRVGRSYKADIHLTDYRVSRTQAILFYQPDGCCWIVDGNGKVGSRNGTFVNGVRVKRRLLEDQDVLFLGSPGVTAQIFLPHTFLDRGEDPTAGEMLLPDDVPTEIGLGICSGHWPAEAVHWSLRQELQDNNR